MNKILAIIFLCIYCVFLPFNSFSDEVGDKLFVINPIAKPIYTSKTGTKYYPCNGYVNKKLIQFKPCALANVSVNYTADGTYATYTDGAPVAIELGLKFQETKVIFRSDVDKGF